MHWSSQQDAALIAVKNWLGDGSSQVFRLFGYAGTGKTTLANEIAASVSGPVLFGAFTGKAAHVLRRKGCEGASTIHSLIYVLDENQPAEQPRFMLNLASPVTNAALVIVDEVSMIDEDIGRDLLSFGTKVLVLGDPAQLPPVKGGGFFTEAEPDVMLTEVHRQAENSPIIRLATTIREGGKIEAGDFGDVRVVRRGEFDARDVLGVDQVLVGLNKTRHAYNARIRELKGIKSATPREGEKLVCLRNDRNKKLLNGSLWLVADVLKPKKPDRGKNLSRLLVLPDDADVFTRGVDIRVKNEFWVGDEADLEWSAKKGTDEFAYAYALTTHKAQGSQWDSVMVFDEAASFREDAWRWRYTAVTRAAKSLTIVVS